MRFGLIASAHHEEAGGGGLSLTNRLTQRINIAFPSGSGDYTSSSFTTVDDSLLVAVLAYNNQDGSISAVIPTPSTSGLTWTQKGSAVHNKIWSVGTQIWIADNASAGSKTIAQSGSGNWDSNVNSIHITILEFTGALAVASQTFTPVTNLNESNDERDPGNISSFGGGVSADSYLVGSLACDGAATTGAPGSGYTQQVESNNGASFFLYNLVETKTGVTSSVISFDSVNNCWDYALVGFEVKAA